MDGVARGARDDSIVVAADGMPVRPLPVAEDAFMGAAIGYLAPATEYAVHFHYALEQLTFVTRGRVEVTTREPGEDEPTTRELGQGEAMTNRPGATLSFANRSGEPAEVLFVCAPPFPADGADVALAGEHRELTAEERARVQERRAWALEHFRRVAEGR